MNGKAFFCKSAEWIVNARHHHLKITHSQSNNNKAKSESEQCFVNVVVIKRCRITSKDEGKSVHTSALLNQKYAIDRARAQCGCLKCDKNVIAVRSPNKMMWAIEKSPNTVIILQHQIKWNGNTVCRKNRTRNFKSVTKASTKCWLPFNRIMEFSFLLLQHLYVKHEKEVVTN